jgi:hypothetical protein
MRDVQTYATVMESFVARLTNPIPHIDNNHLPAGSPMYYYCRACGQVSDVLPETWTGLRDKLCRPCGEVARAGLITYDGIVTPEGEPYYNHAKASLRPQQ